MPLALTCACGKSLRVTENLAGHKVRCPACREVRVIPAARDLEDEAVDILLSGPPAPAPTSATKLGRTRSPRPANATPLPPTRSGPRPLKIAWRQQASAHKPRPEAPALADEDGLNVNAASVTGILLIAVGVAWLASGYAAGYLLAFPPVLLAVGAAATLKGLFGGE